MLKQIEYGYYKSYKLNDEIHRANGPARLWEDGGWDWSLNGYWHRYYGPTKNWDQSWWIHGRKIVK